MVVRLDCLQVFAKDAERVWVLLDVYWSLLHASFAVDKQSWDLMRLKGWKLAVGMRRSLSNVGASSTITELTKRYYYIQ